MQSEASATTLQARSLFEVFFLIRMLLGGLRSLMFNDMRVAHTAKCQGQHFPVLAILLIHFGHGKFNLCVASPNFAFKRDAVPHHCRLSNHLYCRIMDRSLL